MLKIFSSERLAAELSEGPHLLFRLRMHLFKDLAQEFFRGFQILVLGKDFIRHALRFTVQRTQRAYVHPATHFASSDSNPDRPPMGLRVRLKASYDISRFTGDSRVILEALRKYGMFLADNGGNWFVSGAPDGRWDDGELNTLKTVHGSDFEVVQLGTIVHD